MKTKLFLACLFLSTLIYAQYPTNGLISAYELDGNLVDQATGTPMSSTNIILYQPDRFNVPARCANYLFSGATRAGDIDFPHSGINDSFRDNLSYSFWIKTALNDNNRRVLVEDSDRTSDTDTDWFGYYFYLQDGQIKTRFRLEHTGGTHENGASAAPIVADDEWHHVVITMFHGYHFPGGGGTQTVFLTEIFIDGVEYPTNTFLGTAPTNITTSYDTVGDISFGNNRSNNLPVTNRFPNSMDQILIYNRVLTNAEVQTIANQGNYCFVPKSTILSASPINNNDATINISDSGTFDIAYVESSQPFANATIVSGVSSGSTVITGLTPNTDYDVYVREQCAITTSWSADPITFKTTRTIGKLYVNHAATGLNNGTSWADAYTDLQDALAIVTTNEEIWIAAGTYKPTTSGGDRTIAFDIGVSGVKLRGGFLGNEANLSDRVLGTNETILSGDLNGNDDNVIVHGNTTRDDNSYHVVNISYNNGGNSSGNSNCTIDRLTITGGNANASSGTNAIGAAINKDVTLRSLTISDCKITKNTATSTIIYSSFGGNGNTAYLTVARCIIEENVSRGGTLYSVSSGGVYANVYNSIFTKNRSEDNSVGTGYAGSSIYIGTTSTGSNFASTTITNCTFADNEDTGTTPGYNNFNRSTVALFSPSTGVNQATVNNCIFWDNDTLNGITARSVSAGNNNIATILVSNSLDENNFAAIAPANVTNAISANPLFTNSTNGDYTLQMTSPALNSGDNSFVGNITTDLVGNSRIYNGTVDMGAYEDYCANVCYRLTVNVIGSGEVNLNGSEVTSFLSFPANTVLSLVPNAVNGASFVEWNGDATGSSNPLSVTMDADKTITAVFTSAPLYVDLDATGANNGTSWIDAYTDLNTAIANLTSVNKEIWIAEGTYKPTAGDRSNTFNFGVSQLQVYGGFNGTETLLSERDIANNPTILSGDLDGDDTATLIWAQRDDNSYHVVTIEANGIVLDGLIIESGHANFNSANSPLRRGAAVYKKEDLNSLTIANCRIRNNASFSGGAVCAEYDITGTFVSENNIFERNFATAGSGLYTLVRNQANVDIQITNTLFAKNQCINFFGVVAGGHGYTGSSAWIRTLGTGTVTTNITSSTFANNIDTGTEGSVTERGTLTLSRNTGIHNVNISNSIFYNNSGTAGTTVAISSGDANPPSQVNVYNTIDQDGFSNITGGTLVSTSSADPLFVDVANDDFTLKTLSPAIDSGDNSYLPTGITKDLAGNDRIITGTIDLGCYEYNSMNVQVLISPKIFLGGPYNSSSGLMNDGLRSNGHIPEISPYFDSLTCNTSVFATTGNDAIIDWVLIELRDPNDNTQIVSSRSALLQADGDVVAEDGVSPAIVNASSDNYYVVLNHRNHLGIISTNTIALSASSTVVNFVDGSTIASGTNALFNNSGNLVMWPGDSDGNERVVFSGNGNDSNPLKSKILNSSGNFLGLLTYADSGYHNEDLNMNGQAHFSGNGNDSNVMKQNILVHPGNFLGLLTYSILGQLP